MGLGRNVIRILTLTCDEATRLLSESLDRDLPRAERIAFRLHLFVCAQCRRYRRQLLFIEKAVRALRDRTERDEAVAAPAASLSPEARERIKRTLRNP